MIVKAAAKINLLLDVAGILPDGYHSLNMIMQSVSCYDTVRVERTGGEAIKIITADKRVPTDEKNIAYKAAKEFFRYNRITRGRGIEIEIEKKIPMAAGLAGGSADAAAVIFALNALYNKNLSQPELCDIGERVGADVPFSLTGGTAYCTDKGGVIAPLPLIRNCYIVLCKPEMEISTGPAYKLIDEAEYIRHADTVGMLHAVKTGSYPTMCKKACNVFEQVIEVPKRPYIKSVMKKHGADLAMMSGSGPTVYGVFRDEKKAQKCADALMKEFSEVILCETCEKSVETV